MAFCETLLGCKDCEHSQRGNGGPTCLIQMYEDCLQAKLEAQAKQIEELEYELKIANKMKDDFFKEKIKLIGQVAKLKTTTAVVEAAREWAKEGTLDNAFSLLATVAALNKEK